jgi:SAM-dependent methyltransferase
MTGQKAWFLISIKFNFNYMAEEYPEYFARFYDLIYHQIRDGVDNKFYLGKIKNAKGKVLEVGTGTGRLLTEALENGADIYGIDISSSMLDFLKAKLPPEHRERISLQNIVDFKLDRKFNLIIAPFRVFMHLTDKDDQLKALDNVYDHLNKDGQFIFDVFVPDLKPLITGLDNVVDFEGEYEPGNRVKRIVSTNPDLINQIINITFRFKWNEGSSNYSKEWKTPMRFFFRFELEHLIERSKFNKCHIAGDFQGNELKNDSKEFVITCTK